MFYIFSGKFKGKGKLLVLISAFTLTILGALAVALFSFNTGGAQVDDVFELAHTGGVGGFLSRFSLDYDSLESSRELTLPPKDDAVFAEYNRLQSQIGLNVLRFSGKKVEERYLKLKNKTKSGQRLYAVLYIYKTRVVACHLTTLSEGSEIMPINTFV